MVEVFKTSVTHASDGDYLVGLLRQQFPSARINFDLQDCDHILRIEDVQINSALTESILMEAGYFCEILEG
ncbi:hypothetical protein [Marinoscillum sp.]|uniref:hypothetical protein n=1 Tax=Marinoscillum sp. TaxID=2024838 RepID=UPI003BAA325F